MIFTQKHDFLISLEPQKRILALDIGTKKIGVALSDRNRMVATSHSLIKRIKFTYDAKHIFDLYKKNKCSGIVIGVPLQEDQKPSAMEQSIRQFARNLLKVKDMLDDELPIYFQDEKLSSIEAENIMLAADVSRQKRMEKIDKTAAAIILQRFLED